MNDNMSSGLYPQLPPQHNAPPKRKSRMNNPNILNPNQPQQSTSQVLHQPTFQPGPVKNIIKISNLFIYIAVCVVYLSLNSIPAFPAMQNFQAFPSYDMKDMAVLYGANMLNSGRDMVNQEVKNYLKMSRLQYYFAVDTYYVRNKLRLLFFPFTHSDWSVKYDKEGPIQPRSDLNVPDLYIPVMAFVTYILLAGVVLGTQNRFSPEQLGLHASSVLAWTITEVVITVLTLYITNINTKLTTIDILAYSGYKYVGMIAALLLSLAFQRKGYYAGLLYCSLSLAFFLVRSLKCKVLPDRIHEGTEQVDAMNYMKPNDSAANIGYKRGLYILLFVAGIQPLLMWWLSVHLVAVAQLDVQAA